MNVSGPVFSRYWIGAVYSVFAEVRAYLDLLLTQRARYEFYPWAPTPG